MGPASVADDRSLPLQLAICGRPNVGKSTLLNNLVGEERALTGPEPGLTRDAVCEKFRYKGREIALVRGLVLIGDKGGGWGRCPKTSGVWMHPVFFIRFSFNFAKKNEVVGHGLIG